MAGAAGEGAGIVTPTDHPAGESTGAGRVQDPAAGPPVPSRAAQATPGRPATALGPLRDAVAGGKTRENGSAGPLAPSGPAWTCAGPDTPPGAGSERLPAPGRGRAQAPAGRTEPSSVLPAGSTGLRGAEWRQAVKDAQAKTRRRKTTPAAKPSRAAVPLPSLPGGSSVPLVATAHCTAPCERTAGPGPAAAVDRAAEKHVGVGHPTAVIAEPEGSAA